jgi:hypothetical protein
MLYLLWLQVGECVKMGPWSQENQKIIIFLVLEGINFFIFDWY